MAPPDRHNSPLSSLSPLSPLSPRSPTFISSSHRAADDLVRQPPAGHGSTMSHQHQHHSAAEQLEQAQASGWGGRAARGDSAGDDDVKMGDFEGEGAAFGASRAARSDAERTERRGGAGREHEVEFTGEARVDEMREQNDFERIMVETRSPEEQFRPALEQSSSQLHGQEASRAAADNPSRPIMTWQPSVRFKSDYTSPRGSERPYSPPLTPRSARAVASFDLDQYASRGRAPPPPSHAAYRYSLPLPMTSFGPRVIGLHGQTIQRIKQTTNVCEVLVLFRQDRLAKVVFVGTRAAIERALKHVDETITMHTRLGPYEQRFLHEHGMGWCRLDERNLEQLDGYWVYDHFTERTSHGRGDPRPGQVQAPAHGVVSERARPPSPRRRSSRSFSPTRDSCRSPAGADTPCGPQHSPSSPSLESPAEVKPVRLVDRLSSRFEDDAFSSATSQHSLSDASSQVLGETIEEPPSSLTIPIPIAAIERFVGPKAAGHFITQTTGVELKVEAGLDGATLRLEPGPSASASASASASSRSLAEARQLVEKVLVSSGLVAQAPSASKESAACGARASHAPPARAHERRSSAPHRSVVEAQREERTSAEGGRSRSGTGAGGGADGRYAARRGMGGQSRDSGWGGRAQERGRSRSGPEEQTRSPPLDRHRSPAPRRLAYYDLARDSHAGAGDRSSSRTGPPPPRSPRYKSQGYPPPPAAPASHRHMSSYAVEGAGRGERRRPEEDRERSGSAFDEWCEQQGGGRGTGTRERYSEVGQWPDARDPRWRA